jgi:hypothetical protein
MSESSPRKTWWRPLRRFVLYPVLVIGVINLVLTGTPVPLWHLESLHNPVEVNLITEKHLVLVDGQELTLPNISEIPADDRLFQASIADGVEVDPKGNVFGLVRVDRNCGNDPTIWRRLRINLSHLAGAIHPLGIDQNVVPPDVLEFFHEQYRINSITGRSHEQLHLELDDLRRIRKVKEQIDYSIAQAKEFKAEDSP